MRVYIPFTALRAETYLAVPQAILVPLLDKEHGYGRYLWQRWQERESFINVEHDVVPTQVLLQEMWNCDQPLCITDYEGEKSYLGCVKIGKSFIEGTPGIFDFYPAWNVCDRPIYTASFGMYHHHGSVTHLK